MAEPARVWTAVREFMLKSSGVVLSEDQSYLLEGRLEAIAKQQKFASIEKLVSAARAGGAASVPGAALIDAMTTHESSFFRETTFWDAFEKVVIPKLLGHGSGPLRILSAGCSHGQEAYSTAMLLEEHWPQVAARSAIVGTDISATAVERARQGLFSSLEVSRGVSALRLARHFERAPDGFQLKGKLRERVTWRVHNLLAPGNPGETYDVVLCRNVVMYFGKHERRIVLANLSSSLRPGGFIGLGVTEQWSKPQLSPGWYEVGG